MTRILITGAGGFLGQKLALRLASDGTLRGKTIEALTLIDLAAPSAPNTDIPVTVEALDIADGPAVAELFDPGFDVVFHLAAVVSAAAEATFDLGLRVNLMGSINLLEAARASNTCPIFVFASSAAVHGGTAPATVTDGIELNPQTSYGTQKAMAELLLTDMSRRGFVDGRGLRLPTVSIRPGAANAAASSFMSAIFRDTLEGRSANCPVAAEFPVWHSAPRTVVANLIHGAEVEGAALGPNRSFNLPGRTDTIGEMIAAMTHVAGPDAATRITWSREPAIEAIVNGWRGHMRPERALALGFKADASFEDSVRFFLEDDIRTPA
ncbi:MAG: D-erythronate dehydrogenase [Pseudomonadota bacterium]